MSYLEAVTPALVGSIPVFLAWLVGIALAVRMVRRGGGKAEYLLLTGCVLMFVATIVSPLLAGLSIQMVQRHELQRASMVSALPASILRMVGIVCLVCAFWIRWKSKQPAQ